jgi:RNA polymerase sigma factor (sigma-70 family)
MEMTDCELIALTRAGNKEAFSQVIRRHQPRAVRVALGMVGNETAAQEVAQEAMLQAYLSLDRLREPERFASWLHGIVLNVGRSYLREEQRRNLTWAGLASERHASTPIAPDPAWVVEQRERERLILEAVHALSPANREATRLFYWEQLSLQEVAGALGISVGAVKVRLHQSRRQLREQLSTLYPEEMTKMLESRRKQKMINVSVVAVSHHLEPRDREDPATSEAHARRWLMRMIMSQAPGQTYDWVGLMEESGHRFLPIPVGWDTRAIAAVLDGTSPDVSPPVGLMVNLLKAAGGRLEELRVEPLNEEILHATLQVRQNGTVREVDARPGDGIVLAVQTGIPIYLAEEVLDRGAWDLSDPLGLLERLRHTGDEASLRRAIEEPFLVRVTEGMVEHAIRYLHAHRDNSAADVILEPHGDHWIQMNYLAAGSTLGRTLALGPAMFALLTARFKSMANLDLTERSTPQAGRTLIRRDGKEYDLFVSTEPTEFGEQLTLRFQVRTAGGDEPASARDGDRESFAVDRSVDVPD